jgi:hypothetical protein
MAVETGVQAVPVDTQCEAWSLEAVEGETDD